MTNIMADRMTDTYIWDADARTSVGAAIREGFDFSDMSDVDYTDTFGDMDQAAVEMAEFERSLVPAVCYYFDSDCNMSTSIRRRGNMFGHRIRFDRTDDMFCVYVTVRGGFTGVILDLDKIPANIHEYAIVPVYPDGINHNSSSFWVYAMPRADGTLVGSPSYVDGSYMIVPAPPREKPYYIFYYDPAGPESGFRPLRSFEGAPRECDDFGVARFVSHTSAGGAAWRTEVNDLTGSPDVVRDFADFSCCSSLTSAKGAPRRIGNSLLLCGTRVLPWDDDGRCVPLFGDGVRREIGGQIALMSPDVAKDRASGANRQTEMVNIGAPGSGKYNGLAELIADDCSCGEGIIIEMMSYNKAAVLRAVTVANTVR